MQGAAAAPAAGTVLNALATGTGSAFAIDVETTARVTLDDSGSITGAITDGDGDTALIERCVERVVDRFGDGQGGHVETESSVPTAAGLKSSSAAANATVLATLDALDAGDACSRTAATRIGVEAARDAGVTVTGAFDDAAASMLGGLVVTDNDEDDLLVRDRVHWDVLVWTPPATAHSADADVERCRQIAPMADHVADLALSGEYGTAMTVNGLAYAAALGFDPDPMVEAMADARGVSLSGTGPSVVAVGNREHLEAVADRWDHREGRTWFTTTRTRGARVL
ncbi:shikimate kinase [Halococcoides cellulosivorans]|uniref:Shikimate kinase n=1 Tax=Halococcoides cellulosivorans TaxID=1679096 RepID=A0A2R4WYQ7_9EURY|nr:shikimate kinase [Halococcoides cellulosivorans]AWB26654.1 shikimate kinase [Halococcoides cellulosivorans]